MNGIQVTGIQRGFHHEDLVLADGLIERVQEAKTKLPERVAEWQTWTDKQLLESADLIRVGVLLTRQMIFEGTPTPEKLSLLNRWTDEAERTRGSAGRVDAAATEILARLDYALLRRQILSENAQKAGQQKKEKNPTARAKHAVRQKAFELWEKREHGRLGPDLRAALRTEEQFAMEVVRLWPDLTTIGTVRKWSTEWRKQARRNQAKKTNVLAG